MQFQPQEPHHPYRGQVYILLASRGLSGVELRKECWGPAFMYCSGCPALPPFLETPPKAVCTQCGKQNSPGYRMMIGNGPLKLLSPSSGKKAYHWWPASMASAAHCLWPYPCLRQSRSCCVGSALSPPLVLWASSCSQDKREVSISSPVGALGFLLFVRAVAIFHTHTYTHKLHRHLVSR